VNNFVLPVENTNGILDLLSIYDIFGTKGDNVNSNRMFDLLQTNGALWRLL